MSKTIAAKTAKLLDELTLARTLYEEKAYELELEVKNLKAKVWHLECERSRESDRDARLMQGDRRFQERQRMEIEHLRHELHASRAEVERILAGWTKTKEEMMAERDELLRYRAKEKEKARP